MSTLISFRESESSQGHALISLQITPLCHAEGLNFDIFFTRSLAEGEFRERKNIFNLVSFKALKHVKA